MKTNALILILALGLMPLQGIAAGPSIPSLIWGIPSEAPSTQYRKVESISKSDNEIISLLNKNLGEYKTEYFTGNIQRLLMQIQKSDNTCIASSLENRDRLAYAYWTPYGILPPPILVVRKDILPLLKLKNGRASIEDLFNNKKLHGAAGIKRSFGPEIDGILKKYKEATLNRASFDFYSQNILDMINQKRIDYTFEHPYVFKTYMESRHLDQLVAIPIAEAKNPLTTYVVCSRSEFGKSVITKIDKIIREQVLISEYKNATLKFASSNKDPLFLVEIEKFCKLRARRSMIE